MKFTRDKNGLAATIIEPELVNYDRAVEIVESLVGLDGRIYPIPYSYIQNDTLDTLNWVMQALGLYTFPTLELCEWLSSQIDDNPDYEPHPAIEICAGTGWIGRQLGIPSTDIKSMENPIVKGIMAQCLSVPTIYSEDVETMEASEAVNKYKPDIVIGSYVTSKQLVDKIDKKKAMTIGIKLPYGGVMEQNLMDLAREEVKVGVDVKSICRKVYKVILVCNMRTHRNESYISLPHQTLSFPWLVTRGDISQAKILIFENKAW
jgi:hypothetical protein